MWLAAFLANESAGVAAQGAVADVDHARLVSAREKSVMMAAGIDIDAILVKYFQQRGVIDDFMLAALRQRPHGQVRKDHRRTCISPVFFQGNPT